MPVVAADDVKAEEPTAVVAPTAQPTATAEAGEAEGRPTPKPVEVLEEVPAVAVANDKVAEAGECALMPCCTCVSRVNTS